MTIYGQAWKLIGYGIMNILKITQMITALLFIIVTITGQTVRLIYAQVVTI